MASTPPTLRVAQYNVLSQRCAKNDERGFPHVDPQFLDEKARAAKIVAEISRANADVVCLQEFDHALDGRDSELKSLLQEAYEIHIVESPDRHRPCIAVRKGSGWRYQSWCDYQLRRQETQRVMIMVLVHVDTSQRVMVVTTHLKSGAEEFARRALQTVKVIKRIRFHNGKIHRDVPIILCGDLNCEPSECAYHMLKQSSLGLVSGYEAEERAGDHFTTRKMRAQEKRVCEDYILYSPSQLALVAKRQLPNRDSIPYPYLPNADHGSDHLLLWCEFKFTK